MAREEEEGERKEYSRRDLEELVELAEDQMDRGKTFSENFPALIDKISTPERLKSQYHAVIPRLALGNLAASEVDIMSTMDSPILNDLLYAARLGWLPVDVPLEYASEWTTKVEGTRGLGGKFSDQIFTMEKRLTMKRESEKKPSAFSLGAGGK